MDRTYAPPCKFPTIARGLIRALSSSLDKIQSSTRNPDSVDLRNMNREAIRCRSASSPPDLWPSARCLPGPVTLVPAVSPRNPHL